jgi:uncharacterized protein (TIGR00159 family)
MLHFPGGIRFTDFVDIGVVALLIWLGITWFRRTQARLALMGLSILGGVYLGARILGLEVTAWILQGFFTVFVIVVIVVFQDEIRRFFEQIAVWGMGRRRSAPPPDFLEVIAGSVLKLAARRTGALFVFPGREPIERHLEGGVRIDAIVSEALLLSIFDTHSPGHDGAAVFDADRVRSFAARLPLSSNQAALGTRGTRHAAALGLSERSDALVVVVSEERGSVGLARNGALRYLGESEARGADLRRALREAVQPGARPGPAWKRVGTRWLETTFSVLVAALLWFVFSAGSTVIEVTKRVPVVAANVPPGYLVERVEPAEVDLTLSGPRRHIFSTAIDHLEVRLDAEALQSGQRSFSITGEQVQKPDHVEVVEIQPNRVRLTARRTP